MVDAAVIEAVTYFGKNIRENGVSIDDIIIFGSTCTNKTHSESDIDIAVISIDFRGMGIIGRTHLTKDAELKTTRRFRRSLDVLTLTPEELNKKDSLFFQNVRKGFFLSSLLIF